MDPWKFIELTIITGIPAWIFFLIICVIESLLGPLALVLITVAVCIIESLEYFFPQQHQLSFKKFAVILRKGWLIFTLKYKFGFRESHLAGENSLQTLLPSSIHSIAPGIISYFGAVAVGVAVHLSDTADDDRYLTSLVIGCSLKCLFWGYEYVPLIAPFFNDVFYNDAMRNSVQNLFEVDGLKRNNEIVLAATYIFIGVILSLFPSLQGIVLDMYIGLMGADFLEMPRLMEWNQNETLRIVD
mmetsp:Transcript_12587/g.17289  ORF Transcript_12587/g.17289 Transcript_12587/m.17289 type:complete len:243 (+) Transcript_12587:2-730(+)